MPDRVFCKKSKLTECIENIVDEEINRGILEPSHEVFLTSSLTQCPRRLVYRVLAYKGEVSNIDRLGEIDHQYSKAKWVDFISKSSKVKLIKRDLNAADCHYNVVGKIDAILKIREQKIILMVKSVSWNKFHTIKSCKEPPRSDIVETMMNMWLVEIPHGVLLYEDQSSNAWTCYHVVPYQAIINSARTKCHKLLECKITETIPLRPYENSSATECGICEFRKTCWTGTSSKKGS